MSGTASVFTPTRSQVQNASARALVKVGKIVNLKLKNPLDVVKVMRRGVEPEAVDALINKGFRGAELHWIVNPRTLRHRRDKCELLTPEESGRWFRAANIQALALEVLGENEKSMKWLHKPRKAFDGVSAMELMQTETGAQLVEDMLGQLDAGYFA